MPNWPDVWYGGAWGYPDRSGNDIFKTSNSNNITSTRPGIPNLAETLSPIPLPEAPSISMPTLDTNRIASLTQEFASPTIRAGRKALRETLAGGSRSNPVLRGYQTRGAIEGFGDTVEKAVGGARQPAYSLANQELQSNIDTQKTNANMSWAKTLADYAEKVRQRNSQIEDRRIDENYQRKIQDENRQVTLKRGENRLMNLPFSSSPTLGDHRPFTSYEEDFAQAAKKGNTANWVYDTNRGWVPPSNNTSPTSVSQYALDM